MLKTLVIGFSIWLGLFIIRILMMGGLDPGYQEFEVDLLQPYQTYLVSKIDTLLPYPQSALLSGILLGNRSSLPYSLRQELSQTSIIHMVVVSGQNLTILVGLLMGMTSWLGKRQAILISLAAMICYALLTGLQIPVLRAFIMALSAMIAVLLGKQATGWWILLLTAGLMLLFSPNWIFSISFQLSFLATLGLVGLAPMIAQVLKNVPQLLKLDLSVTLAAQALTLPVIASNFNQVSLVGVGANILVLWTIPLVMASGFLSLLVELVIPGLGQILAIVPNILLTYFIYIVELFASLPMATVRASDIGVIGWAGYYLLIGSAMIYLWSSKKLRQL